MKGIYGYYDNIKQKVVYIGQSVDIERRLIRHGAKSGYEDQPINKVIQNNPERYESFILTEGDFTTDELNELEYEAVEIFKTNRYKYPENEGFNFRDGGEVKEMAEETRQKMSEAHNGKTPWNKGIPRSEETKRKCSESQKGEKGHSWKNYARITKKGFSGNKQRYALRFNGGILKISVNPDKLVKWFLENYPNEILKIPKKEEL